MTHGLTSLFMSPHLVVILIFCWGGREGVGREGVGREWGVEREGRVREL